jgi:hypothetical protein
MDVLLSAQRSTDLSFHDLSYVPRSRPTSVRFDDRHHHVPVTVDDDDSWRSAMLPNMVTLVPFGSAFLHAQQRKLNVTGSTKTVLFEPTASTKALKYR